MLLTEFYKSGGHTHNPALCEGQGCCIHNPSKHKMVDWPMNLRASTLIERMCTHGIGHPDPDSVRYMNREMNSNTWSIHGCDGCCKENLCHHPCTTRVLGDDGWSCTRCGEFCGEPCDTCLNEDPWS